MTEAVESHDPFEDTTEGKGATEGDSATFKEPPADTALDPKDATGDKTGTPPDPKDADKADGTEKMIPESRFRAALKDVTDKLEKANGELARKNAPPVPDKDKDPEGYDLHVRLETSKALMREFKPDYQEVIEHYKTMADSNPDLNVAVAKAAIPAKFAYDLAKKDLELTELGKMKDSDEYKEFLASKKAAADTAGATGQTDAQAKASKQVSDALGKVPNLNRATNAAPKLEKIDSSDELFEGSVL